MAGRLSLFFVLKPINGLFGLLYNLQEGANIFFDASGEEFLMMGNLFATVFYLFVGALLGFLAWSRFFSFPPMLLWIGAGAFLLIGLWRLLHLSQG